MDDTMDVVHPRVAGLDVHKMAITTTVLLARTVDDVVRTTDRTSNGSREFSC